MRKNTNSTTQKKAPVGELEAKALRMLADRNGYNMSEQIRWLIRKEAEKQGIWPPKINK